MEYFRFIPQRPRSFLRVRLGMAYYSALRHWLWWRWRKRFASRHSILPCKEAADDFPHVAASHRTPLRRNLSPEDTALQEGKVVNLQLATSRLNGVVVEPGKVFSFWRLIGNPTSGKGYQQGMVLLNGRPSSAVGGGLCALSNLVYWLTLHTPLTVVERYRHSYDVFPDSNRTQPFGSGATCLYNYRDLMIRNSTSQPYLLSVWTDHHYLYGQWRTGQPIVHHYEVYQKKHWITAEIGNAYVRHNTIWRHHYVDEDGKRHTLPDEFVAENHALMMYEPLLEESNQT